MNNKDDPIVSIGFVKDEASGTYFAQMFVTGFKTAAEAEACVQIIHERFCGQEVAQIKS